MSNKLAYPFAQQYYYMLLEDFIFEPIDVNSNYNAFYYIHREDGNYIQFRMHKSRILTYNLYGVQEYIKKIGIEVHGYFDSEEPQILRLTAKDSMNLYENMKINYELLDKDNNLHNWLEGQKNVLSKKTEINKIKTGLLNYIDSNWRNVDINNLKSYIEEEYMYYSYGLLDEKNVNKLLNSGAFIYTDDKEIVKATEESFLSKIKLR